MIYSFGHQTDVHDYFSEFIKLYKPNIFLTNKKHYLALLGLCYNKKITVTDLKVIHTYNGLKKKTDVLIYPWGYPDSEKRISNLQKIFSAQMNPSSRKTR